MTIVAGQRIRAYVQGEAIRDTVLGVPIPFSAPTNDAIRSRIISGLTPWFRVWAVSVESSTAADTWLATCDISPLASMDAIDVRAIVHQSALYDATETASILVTLDTEGPKPELPPGPLGQTARQIGDAAGSILEGVLAGGGVTLVLVAIVIGVIVLRD